MGNISLDALVPREHDLFGLQENGTRIALSVLLRWPAIPQDHLFSCLSPALWYAAASASLSDSEDRLGKWPIGFSHVKRGLMCVVTYVNVHPPSSVPMSCASLFRDVWQMVLDAPPKS